MTEPVTITVHPEFHLVRTVAKQLLALADKPLDVEFVSWPTQGFRVPVELFQRWEDSLPKDAEGDPVVVQEKSEPKVLTLKATPSAAEIDVAEAREAAEEKKTNKKPGPKPKTTLKEQ